EARRLHGMEHYGQRSRFLKEIPPTLVHELRPRVGVSRPLAGEYNAGKLRATAIEDASGWKLGDRVRHMNFGLGTIADAEGSGNHARVQVNFDQHGSKWLVLSFANLKPG